MINLDFKNLILLKKYVRLLKKSPKLSNYLSISNLRLILFQREIFDLKLLTVARVAAFAEPIEHFFYHQNSIQKIKVSRKYLKVLRIIRSRFYFRNRKHHVIGYKSFFLNARSLRYALFNAFYYNFFVVALQETGFTKDIVSINYNSSYWNYSDILNFFTLNSWIALKRYWIFKFYEIKNVVIIAADNHLANHLNKSHFFIVDFLSNSYNLFSNSITAYFDIYDDFFAAVFIGYVYKFKITSMNLRYNFYINFYSKLLK